VSHSVNLKPRSRRGLFFVGPLTINAGQYPIISSACRPAIAYSMIVVNWPPSRQGNSRMYLRDGSCDGADHCGHGVGVPALFDIRRGLRSSGLL
jgi:hypothetical protein